jgi:hypothetical protein
MQRMLERRLARLEGDAADDVLDRLTDDEVTILLWEALRALADRPDASEPERMNAGGRRTRSKPGLPTKRTSRSGAPPSWRGRILRS